MSENNMAAIIDSLHIYGVTSGVKTAGKMVFANENKKELPDRPLKRLRGV